MKIFHICNNFGSVYKELFAEQKKQNNKVDAFFYTLNRHAPQLNLPEYFSAYYSNSYIRGPFLFHFRLLEIKKVLDMRFNDASRYDIIHAHMLFSDGDLAYTISKKYGIPFGVTVRNSDLNTWFYWKFSWNRNRGFKILKNAQFVIFHSISYREKLLARLPKALKDLVLEKSYIVPNGIDMFWHDNTLHERKTQGDFAKRTINLLTVARIEKNKNQINVCKAINVLKSRGYNVQYFVIGKIIDSRVGAYLQKQGAIILGEKSKEDVLEYYRKSDIYVMLSFHETFGLTYVEAMTQGLPVLYSQGEGFDKQFPEGCVGYAADPYDELSIANCLEKIMSNYEKISVNGTKLARQFQWNIVAKLHDKIYSKTCGM